ncbi:SpoIIE family protein phosphatase [Streptomyces sp. V4-01]|uniref:SpoIIE family protein phosphatase n=1 Tax=Actinacidiphila polyblastidii TaxID=3110430 RepID=A0ABU7PHF8_9ACTN|nr:SpoIIE family protein phosphatase [Streptomyces sp. V4-01]
MPDFEQTSGRSGRSGRPAEAAATATLGPTGVLTGWSEGARRLLGYPAAEVVGRAAVCLLAARNPPAVAALSLIDTHEWSGSAALRHRDGHPLDVVLRASPLLGADGTTRGFVVTAAPDVRAAPAGRTGQDAAQGAAPESAARESRARATAERSFAQSSIAMSTYTTASGAWRLNTFASGEDRPRPPDGNQPPGSPYPELLTGGQADRGFLWHVRRVAEEGRPLRYEHRTPDPFPFRRSAWIVEMWPVRDPDTGQVCGVGTAAFDGSEEYRARQRLALLNEAGRSIGTTLDVTRTAQELADLAAPRLADFVSVDLLDSVMRGEEPLAGPVPATVLLRRIAHGSGSAGVPEAAVGVGEVDVYPRYAPPARALASGRPVLSGDADPDFTRWVTADELRHSSVTTFGFHSLMAVPLRARGTTLGVAVFARARSTPLPFAHDDLVLAEELAGRAAVGMDNARRYTRERTNALALQRSLLPREIPAQAAVEVAYRYLPARSGLGVGGDWFDVVSLSGTRVALVVGDVVGHGIHASATMGRLRTAVRTLADVDLPPDELLTHLDDLVAHFDSDRDDGGYAAAAGADGRDGVPGEIGATCLYAVYDPISRICTLASAGHTPPALVLPDGRVSLVRLSPGPLLGVGGLPFESTELKLPEGSLLVVHTDGLVAARDHDVGRGQDRLCAVLAEPWPTLEAACDGILRTMLPDSPADDVALVLARTRALPADQVADWALPSDPAIVADARAQAVRQLDDWGLEEVAPVTELVVSELVTNAIRYGDLPIGLRLIRDETLICEVSDASSTAPHMRRARVGDEGGRGLHLVAQLTQGWGARQTPTGKTIWAEQALPADRRAA